MAEYVNLDDEALQDLLANASSYDERSTIRQEIRRRKKERGQTVSKGEARGRSSYNRFAGSTGKASSTAAKSFELPKSALSEQNNTPALKPVKKDAPASKHRSPTPPPVQASPERAPDTPPQSQSPEEDEAIPPQQDGEAEPEEVDGTPVTEELAEDEPTHTEDDDGGIGDQEQEEEEEQAGDVAQDTDGVDKEDEQPGPAQEEDAASPYVGTEEVDVSDGPKDLQHYLVVYVNKELGLEPPLPSRGKALYDTCSDPTVLCKLINKSVAGNVDLRALSKVRGTAAQRKEAIEENMTLVVESGRSIGCPVEDDTAQRIIQKDPGTINNFLVDLIRARVVHLPGMEDEPSSTFSDWTYLFEKLNISVSSNDSPSESNKKEDKHSERTSWRESGSSDSPALTYEQRAAKRKAEREQRQREKDADGSSVGLTYEERAQQRKAERERRKREREALAK